MKWEKYDKMGFDFYMDPGHGWIKVSIKLLRDLNIAKDVSCFSYYSNGFGYLEEDCDAALLFKALEAVGTKPVIRDHHTDQDSPIRDFACFCAELN